MSDAHAAIATPNRRSGSSWKIFAPCVCRPEKEHLRCPNRAKWSSALRAPTDRSATVFRTLGVCSRPKNLVEEGYRTLYHGRMCFIARNLCWAERKRSISIRRAFRQEIVVSDPRQSVQLCSWDQAGCNGSVCGRRGNVIGIAKDYFHRDGDVFEAGRIKALDNCRSHYKDGLDS